MDVAIYRARGASLVLVHATLRPPLLAEASHGPLHHVANVQVDGASLGDAWARFADEISQRSFAVIDGADADRLLRRLGAAGDDAPGRRPPLRHPA